MDSMNLGWEGLHMLVWWTNYTRAYSDSPLTGGARRQVGASRRK